MRLGREEEEEEDSMFALSRKLYPRLAEGEAFFPLFFLSVVLSLS